MNAVELVRAVRVRFDDENLPYLVSDETILEQASMAEGEFARATLALYDIATSTTEVGNSLVSLPSNFFTLSAVMLNNVQLRLVTVSELDFGYYTFDGVENSRRFGDWRTATGVPRFAVIDMYPDKIRLVPSPTSVGTINMEGYAYPPSLSISSTPQIPSAYHELLVIGTLLRLNLQTDIDISNPGKAQIYSEIWYKGIAAAQENFRTALRRHVRVMELPRGFNFTLKGEQQ